MRGSAFYDGRVTHEGRSTLGRAKIEFVSTICGYISAIISNIVREMLVSVCKQLNESNEFFLVY